MNCDEEIVDYVASLGISQEIHRLIAQANYDLFNGAVFDDPGYPGFSVAVSQISEFLDCVDDLWIDVTTGGYSITEPHPYEEDGELIEPCFGDYCLFQASDVKRKIVGTELAQYI